MTEDEILENINKLAERYNTDDIDLKYTSTRRSWYIAITTWDEHGNLLNTKGWRAKELERLFFLALTGDLVS